MDELTSVAAIIALAGTGRTPYLCSVDPGAHHNMELVRQGFVARGIAPVRVLEGWARSNCEGGESALDWPGFERLAASEGCGDKLVLLGSQMDFSATRRKIAFCRDHGVPCLFMLDHWSNYGEHFIAPDGRATLPDRVMVMDDYARQRMVEALSGAVAGFDPAVVRVVGHPNLERSVRGIKAVDSGAIAAFRREHGLAGPFDLLLLDPFCQDFGMGPHDRDKVGYTEYVVMDEYARRFAQPGRPLLVKPHPRQDGEAVARYLARRHPDLDARLLAQPGLDLPVAAADRVFGMVTIALVIAHLAGKAIVSLQPGRTEAGAQLSSPHLERHLAI